MAVLAAARDAALRARERVWSNGTCVGAVACLMFPFTSACVKLLHGRVPILEICLIRSAIAWAASLALGAATRVSPLWGRPANARYLVGRGVAGTLAVTCNYTAVALLPLGDAAGLNMLKPCAVAAAGWLLLGEPLGAAGAAGLAVSVAGVVVLVHPPALFGGHAESGRQRVLGTAAALGSSAFAAGVAFSIRRIGRSEAALTVALAFHSCTLVMSSPTLALSWPAPAVLPAPRDWGLLVAIALTSFAAQLLLTRSFQLLPAGRASAMGFTSVIYSEWPRNCYA
ncbi:MAG: hypothetical protein J3K34DRAFT_406007 [Monoraphidium minutum]|nr:MAG: hypothetical protein J3K34DRAFT_406007 [Monoraphidium minutum]